MERINIDNHIQGEGNFVAPINYVSESNPTIDFFAIVNNVFGTIKSISDYYNIWQEHRQMKAKKKLSKQSYEKACLHISQGNYNTAYQFYLNALMYDCYNAEIHNSFAWNLAVQKESLDIALFHAKSALRLNPEKSMFHDTIAEVYYQQGNFSKALSHSKEALQLFASDRTKFEIFRRIGFICIESKQYDNAIRNMKNALKFQEAVYEKTRVAITYETLASIYYICKNYTEQLKCLYNVKKMYPQTARILNSIAWSLAIFFPDEKEKALKYAQEAVNFEKANSSFCDTLAEALYINGKYDESLQQSARAYKMNPSPEQEFLDTFRRGRIQFSLGNYRNAIVTFKKCISKGIYDLAFDEACVYCYVAYAYWNLNDKSNTCENINIANKLSNGRWQKEEFLMSSKNAIGNNW